MSEDITLEGKTTFFPIIDKQSRNPIYEQFIEQVERNILLGNIQENEQLPSVRSMSVLLSVNPNTLQKAYIELERQKISYSVPGSGRFIAVGAKSIVMKEKLKLLEPLKVIVSELKLAGAELNFIISTVKEEFNK
ncbi:MAG: GntR family transcriptional regulator [Clostridia bacterium]